MTIRVKRRTRVQCALFALGALAVAGCGERRDEPATTNVGETPEPPFTATVFAPVLGIALDSMTQTAAGIYIHDVRTGSGAIAEPGRTVVLEYSAWLPDGTLYEKRPNEEGFSAAELTLGDGEPRGLHEGVTGMRTGGTRRIVVPPDLGYGLVGRPAGVPARSPLIFEVRLRAVR